MPTLADFTAFVTDMEKGNYPACFGDRTAAAKQLVDDICVAPWENAEQREAAQGLVARLERLRHQDGANAAPVHEPSAILQQMVQPPHDGTPDDGQSGNTDGGQRIPQPRNRKGRRRMVPRCKVTAPSNGEGSA